MAKKQIEKPLTLKGLVEYNHSVLFPTLEERFVTKREFFELKEDVNGLRGEFSVFKDQSLSIYDEILNKLDVLMQEKDVAFHQYQQQKKFNKIVAKSLEKHSILTPAQTNEIKELGVV